MAHNSVHVEEGHFCPKCNANSVCGIEDGACDNAGLCGDCFGDAYIERLERREREGYHYDED